MTVSTEEFYAKAREHGDSIWGIALEEAKDTDREQLERWYADAVALNAYYSRIEAKLSAVPRLSFDAIRQALLQIRADELLAQAAAVEAEGGTLSNHVTVRTVPLLTLLSRCAQIVGDQSLTLEAGALPLHKG